MAEEAGNPVIDAGQFLGEDGAFSDNWLEQAYGAEDPLRADPTLKNTKSVRSMASQLVNAQKQIGQFSGGREFAILPNEQSDETEINEYRKKTGMPPAPADYKLAEMKLPEGLPKDDKLSEHMSNILHKAGASTSVATEVHNGYVEYIKSSMEAVATQEKIDSQEANKALRGKWGAAYDKNMALAVVAANAFGSGIDATETAALIKELPYDTFAAQMLAKAGEVISEKGLGEKPADTTGELTPADAMTEANKVMTDPYYVSDTPSGKPRNKQYHDELVQKVARLMEMATNKGGVAT